MTTRLSRLIPAGALALITALGTASAQENPVYVDDSPLAWELFREAEDQAAENVGEAVRIYQELLDEFWSRLVPADRATADRFRAVRLRVVDALLRDSELHGGLLERYRIMEHAEARRLHDAGEFERLAMTRPLTEPGLDALLRVAQRHVESARFASASHKLDLALRHPDLPRRLDAAAHAWFMRGMASHFQHDFDGRDGALKALDDLAPRTPRADRLSAELQRIAATPGPTVRRGLSALDQPATANLEDLVAEEIWSIELEESLFNRRFDHGRQTRQPVRRGMQQMRESGHLLAAAATAVGDVVYINQGHHVLALDRFTGSPRWPRPFVDRASLTVVDRADDHPRDMNIVTVEGDALVTLTGHAHANVRSSEGSIVCLDAETGDLRWSQRLDRIGNADEYEGLFPHSAPIVAEGRVYVLGRRMSPQSLTSTYLVALDLEDGQLHWIRHVVSSGSIRRAPRSFSTLVYQDGDLYVHTAVGAVARIEASSGQTRWLVRFPVTLNPRTDEQTRRPWEMHAPIVAGDRVLGLIPGDRPRILVLDRETGHTLESHDVGRHDPWSSPSYMLSDGQWLYLIGGTGAGQVRAFDVRALEQPIWSLDQVPEPNGERLSLRGRVQLVAADDGSPRLIVPAQSRMLIVDGESGRIANSLSVTPGNPLAVNAQLFIADDQRLSAFMSMRQAVGMLDDRIAANPRDPEPALSLLRLAIRSGNFELTVAAAGSAMQAMGIASDEPGHAASEHAEAQRQLFEMLLHAVETERLAANSRDAESLFALLDAVVAEPSQRLAYLLAYGDWLSSTTAREMIDRAIATYQSILADSRLRSMPRMEDEVIRPAAAWVTARLAGLIDQHGGEVYESQVAAAERRLEQLNDAAPGGIPSTRELLAIVDEYPLAPAAVDASIQAAQDKLAAGDHTQALAAIMRLYRSLPHGPAAGDDLGVTRRASQRLLDAYATISRQAGWGDIFAAYAHTLSDVEEPVTPLPAAGTQRGDARAIEGSLLPVDAQVRDLPRDARLLFKDGRVRLIEGPDLRERWSVEVVGSRPRLLHIDDDRVLLWFESRTDPRAALLDLRDGRHLWTTPRLSEHLTAERRAGAVTEMPNGEPFDPRETLALCDGRLLVFVQRAGGAVAFDLANGQEPLWSRHLPVQQVHLVDLQGGMLVLAGMHRPDGSVRGGLRPAIDVIDVQSGRSMHEQSPLMPLNQTGFRWMRVAPLGMLVGGSEEGLEAWDLRTGTMQWATRSEELAGAGRGWTAADRLIVQLGSGGLSTLNVHDGTRLAVFEPAPYTSPEASPELRDIEIVDGAVLVRFADRVVRYDFDGTVRGADIIRDERRYRWLLPAEDRLIVISWRQPRQELVPGQSRRRTHHFYRVYTLSANGRLLDEPVDLPALFEPLGEVDLIDGWLLLSTQEQTIAIPYPAEE